MDWEAKTPPVAIKRTAVESDKVLITFRELVSTVIRLSLTFVAIKREVVEASKKIESPWWMSEAHWVAIFSLLAT